MGAQNLTQHLSPKSSSGSLLASVLIHLFIAGSVIGVMKIGDHGPVQEEQYVDLGYEELDAPPIPQPVVKQVADTPHELQDAKSEVVGTQKEAPPAPKEGEKSAGATSDVPYYKIKPKYPREALVSGTEGWVILQIDVTETGEVENVRVIDGEQKNMFQAEARRAVAQWKYRPFTDNSGNPVKKIDHQVRVDFHLKDAVEGGS